ncbi:transcriptional regulator [Nostoc sp. 3335mG]|nr:transcriptional regulator [Nostoc sp. 3335mG]
MHSLRAFAGNAAQGWRSVVSLNQSYRWRGLDLATIEHCHVLANDRDTRIRGAIVGPDFGLFYRLKLDENGHARTLKIERADGRNIELFADGAGGWSDDRAEPISTLKGCIDVDIWPTPMTNSLPIWRSAWEDGKAQKFLMVWIDATTMEIRREEQVYTRLDPTHFRFQSNDFEAVLAVDGEGVVTDYPGLFARG